MSGMGESPPSGAVAWQELIRGLGRARCARRAREKVGAWARRRAGVVCSHPSIPPDTICRFAIRGPRGHDGPARDGLPLCRIELAQERQMRLAQSSQTMLGVGR